MICPILSEFLGEDGAYGACYWVAGLLRRASEPSSAKEPARPDAGYDQQQAGRLGRLAYGQRRIGLDDGWQNDTADRE